MFRRIFVAFVPALVLLVIDRGLKIFFLTNPAVRIGGDFLFGLLTLHLELNAGIAFGIIAPHILILFFSGVTIIFLILFLIKHRSIFVSCASMLVVAGAVSNFFDRIRYGAVIDYIDIPWFTVLNIADMMISIGAVLMALALWRDDKKISLTQ